MLEGDSRHDVVRRNVRSQHVLDDPGNRHFAMRKDPAFERLDHGLTGCCRELELLPRRPAC